MKKILFAIIFTTAILFFYGDQILTRLVSAYLTITHQVPIL